MSPHPKYNNTNNGDAAGIAAWYMTSSDGSKALVLHNVASSEMTLELESDKLDSVVVKLGKVSVSGHSVTLGANSSAVFLQ